MSPPASKPSTPLQKAESEGPGLGFRPNSSHVVSGNGEMIRSRQQLQEIRRQRDLASANQRFGGKTMREAYIANHRSLPPMPKPFQVRVPSPEHFMKAKLFVEKAPVIKREVALPHHSPAVDAFHPTVKLNATNEQRYLHHRLNTEQRPSSGTLNEDRPLYSSFSPDRIFRMDLKDPTSTPASAYMPTLRRGASPMSSSTPSPSNTINSSIRGGWRGMNGGQKSPVGTLVN